MDISDIDVVSLSVKTYRLIPSRFPPVDLYNRITPEEDLDILHQIESITNSRLRNNDGQIALVPEEDQITDNGSMFIMAAFTHPKVMEDGGRFNKDFGVYYCAHDLDTAIEETKYHRAKFFRDFNSGPTKFDMRTLIADLNQDLHTVADLQDKYPEIYMPSDYSQGQLLGKALKEAKSWGLRYSSVRCDGICYAIFRPPALSNCRQTKHFEYHFDGQTITTVIRKTEHIQTMASNSVSGSKGRIVGQPPR